MKKRKQRKIDQKRKIEKGRKEKLAGEKICICWCWLDRFVWHHQELIGRDCGGGVARNSIAVGCRWVTSGVVRMGCGAVCGGMGIALG